MKNIEISGKIDTNNRLILDESLDVIKPQKVEIDIWFRDDDEGDYHEKTKSEILDGIREGLRDCLTGNTYTAKEMWDSLLVKATGTINDEGQLILDEPLRTTKPQDVDVVIWFIKDKKDATEVAQDIDRDNLKADSRELSMSEK